MGVYWFLVFVRAQGVAFMFDFVLALARLLVDIPRIAVSNDANDDIVCLDVRGVERRYEGLSDVDKRHLAEYWLLFQAIAVRQNEIHQDAVRLNRELIRWIGCALASPDLGQELGEDGRLEDGRLEDGGA
jgi:hypothetical protein